MELSSYSTTRRKGSIRPIKMIHGKILENSADADEKAQNAGTRGGMRCLAGECCRGQPGEKRIPVFLKK